MTDEGDDEHRLIVFLHGRRCGELRQSNRGVTYDFRYYEEWLRETRSLSRSLPVRPESFEYEACQPFFAGLLPEGQARAAVARELRLSEDNDFSLLRELGGECAGAVSLLPPKIAPRALSDDVKVKWLTESELAQRLRDLPAHPLLAVDGEPIRLSLAGAQAKVPLYSEDGERFAIPLEGTPTTHILKIPIPDLTDTVYNECLCLWTAGLIGLTVAEASLSRAEDVPFLVVKRYDREHDAEGHLVRIHQEDFCQALGFPPSRKYEAEGGPRVGDSASLIREAASTPARDLAAFMETVVFNYLIGNGDAHGKNYSLLYRQTATSLAPAYDLISTSVYDRLETKMAMRIGGEYRPTWVKERHWRRFVEEAEVSVRFIRRITELAERIPDAVSEARTSLEERGFRSPMLQKVEVVVRERAAAALTELR